MSSSIHVKTGFDFQPTLHDQSHKKWLSAVGKELETKGISVTLGDGASQIVLSNSSQLEAFYEQYSNSPQEISAKVGIPVGQDLEEYFRDLLQALDDVAKNTSFFKKGDVVDLSTKGELSQFLGLDDASVRYASSNSSFGKIVPVEGAKSVLGIMLGENMIDPLENVPHISAATFEGVDFASAGREGEEFEAVRRLGGLDKDQLLTLIRTPSGNSTLLNKLRKAKDAEAFSVGYSGMGIDEMRWDSRAHKTREESGYVSLTIEGSRMEFDQEDGRYEVALGTDYNEDIYFDDDQFHLLDNEMSIRARIRRDEPKPEASAIRRVLIQSKMGSSVDENGMKSASKTDIRRDTPSENLVNGMVEDVMSGTCDWADYYSSSEEPIKAIGFVYRGLLEAGVDLEDIGPHKDVLLLKEKAHVRSTRSRFHFAETPLDAIKTMFLNGGKKIDKVSKIAKDSPAMDASSQEKLQTLGASLLDRSWILEKSKDKLLALNPSLQPDDITKEFIQKLSPSSNMLSSERSELRTLQAQVVAESFKEGFDEFAKLLDDNLREISNSRSPEARAFGFEDEMVDFLKTKNTALQKKTTFQPFIDEMDAKLASPEKDAFVLEFSTWLKETKNQEDLLNAPDKDLAFAGIRQNMLKEEMDLVHRQIEAAGTAGQQLWFEEAKKTFVDSYIYRSFNFLIDTFDVSEFYTPDAWAALTPEERSGMNEVSADKIMHAELINEVQIELGLEKPYLEAISRAKKNIQNAKSGQFMDFVLTKGLPEVEANKPETFVAFVEKFNQSTDVEQSTFLKELNESMNAKGCLFSVTKEDIAKWDASSFMTPLQGQDPTKQAALQTKLSMAEFVWQQLLNAQDQVANLRGRRVEEEVKDAGFNNVTWEDSPMSKGDRAISLVRDLQNP